MSTTKTLRTQLREDYLTCSICFNNFIKPKALPCLHTYCEGCLRDYVVSRGFESAGCFPCPTCRLNTAMPDTGVEGFPDNYLMSSLSDTIESSAAGRPVPKPRRSLGVAQEQENKEKLSSPTVDTSSRTPELSKVCSNDSEDGWEVVPQEPPSASAPPADGGNKEEKCNGSGHSFPYESNSQSGLSASSAHGHSGAFTRNDQTSLYPRPPPYYHHPAGTENTISPAYPPGFSAASPIGWNFENLPSVSGSVHNIDAGRNEGKLPNSHSPIVSLPASQTPSSQTLYPAVPTHQDNSNTACTENLLLRFGKQGSSLRDFIKPIGLAVSKEGNYVVSDSSADQNRIFIFNSAGELTTAFNCGCKVKDIAMTKNNEIIAAVHKSVCAVRLFTMAGQCKGEFGKFFTFEEPCGISQLTNGGIAVTGTQNHCVYVLTDQMKLGTKFGRKGNGDGYFQHPGHVTVDSKNHIIVTDKINSSIQVFSCDGKFKLRFGGAGKNHSQLQAPLGICVDDADNIIVADSGNFRVEVFSSKGRWLSSVVTDTNELGDQVKPVNVAYTPTGKVAVLLRGPYFAEVRVYSSRHKHLTQKDGPVSLTSVVWLSN